MEQSFFYWAQGIYAIAATLLVVVAIGFLILLYKKVNRLEKRMEILADKSIQTADSVKNIVGTGEKLVIYSFYRLLRKFIDKKDNNSKKEDEK